MRLPEKYENEMKDLLQEEYEAYKESLSLPIQQGYRINTGKISKEEWEKIAPFSAKEVPWIENGYFLLDDFRASRHPYYFAGLYYLQEPSAMTPANRLNVEPGLAMSFSCLPINLLDEGKSHSTISNAPFETV